MKQSKQLKIQIYFATYLVTLTQAGQTYHYFVVRTHFYENENIGEPHYGLPCSNLICIYLAPENMVISNTYCHTPVMAQTCGGTGCYCMICLFYESHITNTIDLYYTYIDFKV